MQAAHECRAAVGRGAAAGRPRRRRGLVDVAYTTVDSPVGDRSWWPPPSAASCGSRSAPRSTRDALRRGPERARLAHACSRRRRTSTRSGGELDEYFEGRRTELRPAARLVAHRRLRPPRAEAHRAHPVRRGLHLPGRSRAAAGSPRAVRAAGNALGANPIPLVVPCHRVLRSGGGLGGYGGGPEVKEFLLQARGACDWLAKDGEPEDAGVMGTADPSWPRRDPRAVRGRSSAA